MHGIERPRSFQYSSLVMGSKDIPAPSFPAKKPLLSSSKGFGKKNDVLAIKYPKACSHKIRTRNERPDIYLEGEQVSKNNQIWERDVDIKYLNDMRERFRRNAPNTVARKTSKQQRVTTNMAHRSSPTWADSEDDSPLLNMKIPYNRRTANTLVKGDLHRSSQQQVHSSGRQKTAKDSPSIRRPVVQTPNLQKKINQKTQLKLVESLKAVEQFKRKQLFYISQKDLASIRAQSFVVSQYPSGQIVTGYYYKRSVQIASLTKIMTYYTVIKVLNMHQLDPEKQMVIVDDVSAQITGTSAELVEGDHYSVLQLLYGLMLPSGNDAAVALARWGGKVLGGDAKEFIALMNKSALEIGMKASTFGNPHGLPHPNSASTAEDLSILVLKCLDLPHFREIVKCKKYKCWIENSGVRREVVWENTNKLLRRPGFEGVKTGVTVTAGPCLASLYTVRERTFIIILLRTNKMSRRFKETRWILSLCLRRLNFDGIFTNAIRQMNREDPENDSDNSEDQQEFHFDRNDPFQFEHRRKIIINDL